MATEEYPSDSEEILVYAEFEDSVDIEKYTSIHVLGVDGPNPIIQMDDSFFNGKYTNALGTYMFFEEDKSPECEDPLFDKLPEKNLKYVTKTRKLLKMDHAYVLPREEQEQNANSVAEAADDDVQPVHFKSVQEAVETILSEMDIKSNPREPQPGSSADSCEPMDTEQL